MLSHFPNAKQTAYFHRPFFYNTNRKRYPDPTAVLNLSADFTVYRIMKFLAILVLSAGSTGLFPLSGCSKNTYDNRAVPVATSPTNNDSVARYKTYLALGDSYTIGQSVDVTQRFPAQTVTLLQGNNITIKQPEYIATTGWTTANLQAAIQSTNPKGPYDVVSLLIGVNDQFQHMDTGGYRFRFTQLLQKSIQLAGNKPTHVFVLSIPDYSVTPFGKSYNPEQTSKEIDWFNAINRQVTAQFSCPYLDITPSTREAATNSSLVADDGLHPSGAEYRKWAAGLAPLMQMVL